MKNKLKCAGALLVSLLLGGCMLPRMFVAAFIPFQRFMIWGAAMAARYGAPLVMLMVDASPCSEPSFGPADEIREPYFYEEKIAPEMLKKDVLAKVYIIDCQRMGDKDYAALLKDAASKGQNLSFAPLGEAKDALKMEAFLNRAGVETEWGTPIKSEINETPEGEL